MPAMVVAIVMLVPVMVVFEAAVRAVPISAIETLAIMVPGDPMSALIGRTRPVAGMPNVTVVYRIPVAINPHVFRPRRHGANTQNPDRWRCANANADLNLAECRSRCHQGTCQEQCASPFLPVHVHSC